MTTITHTNLPNPFHRGKVRDTYRLGDGLLLMVATDRISAFDVVLPNGIPDKGLVLAGLSAFWFRRTAHIVPNHLLYYPTTEALGTLGRALSLSEEAKKTLMKLPRSIAERAMVVRQAGRIDIECVVRGYLAGSAWAEYRQSGTVHGQALPKGLREGEKLQHLLFTPTTKAETGHDLPMPLAEVEKMVGHERARQLQEKTLAVYAFAHDYALTCGIIIADTKLEFGLLNGQLILIDELLTPDSSRFWDAQGYGPGKSQPNYDKQFVRDWLTSIGWNREPPAPELPPDIVERTRGRYLEAYRKLTGQNLSEEEK